MVETEVKLFKMRVQKSVSEFLQSNLIVNLVHLKLQGFQRGYSVVWQSKEGVVTPSLPDRLFWHVRGKIFPDVSLKSEFHHIAVQSRELV
jgi:hypothetical protein